MNLGFYKKKKNKDLYFKGLGVFIFALALWVLLLSLGFFALYFHEDKISRLNEFGGFMNISTSLVGVATIFLLSKAISYQKKELKEMKKEMKKQRKSIENEERTNRTIKYIDEWISCCEHEDEFTNDQKNYITRLSLLFSSSAKSKVDFKLLYEVISKYGLNKILENEFTKLTHKKELYEKAIKDKDFSDYERAEAEKYLEMIESVAITQAEENENISYSDAELGMSVEEYLIDNTMKELGFIEDKLQELKVYVSFVHTISKIESVTSTNKGKK